MDRAALRADLLAALRRSSPQSIVNGPSAEPLRNWRTKGFSEENILAASPDSTIRPRHRTAMYSLDDHAFGVDRALPSGNATLSNIDIWSSVQHSPWVLVNGFAQVDICSMAPFPRVHYHSN
jgi:hypothetical protein